MWPGELKRGVHTTRTAGSEQPPFSRADNQNLRSATTAGDQQLQRALTKFGARTHDAITTHSQHSQRYISETLLLARTLWSKCRLFESVDVRDGAHRALRRPHHTTNVAAAATLHVLVAAVATPAGDSQPEASPCWHIRSHAASCCANCGREFPRGREGTARLGITQEDVCVCALYYALFACRGFTTLQYIEYIYVDIIFFI